MNEDLEPGLDIFGPLAGRKHTDRCALHESPENVCDCGAIPPEQGDA